jgi:hypothetical protein
VGHATLELIDKNLYKGERNVYALALQIVRFLINDFQTIPEVRSSIFERALGPLLRSGNYIESAETKIELI